jgi:hypothetical protein
MMSFFFQRVRMLVGVILVVGAPAVAQTATPTPPATPTPTATCIPRGEAACAGAKKLNIAWFAKDPFTVRMSVSATACPALPSCEFAVDGELVTRPPLAIQLEDSNGLFLAETITDPGINSGGCPGGSDSYRGTSRLKLVFGADGLTTVIGKTRFTQPGSLPPTLSPPITVTIRDACGVLDTATVNTCYPRFSGTTAAVKCF